MDNNSFASIASAITAFCALAGVAIAYLGLQSWQRELRGRHAYELARRIMVLVYKTRGGLRRVQFAGMYASEWEGRPARDPSAANCNELDHRFAYSQRLAEPQATRAALYVELFEAEAIWGPILVPATFQMERLHEEILLALQLYLDGGYDEKIRDSIPKEQWEKARGIVFNMAPYSAALDKQFNDAISAFETVLRPHLRPSPSGLHQFFARLKTVALEIIVRLNRPAK